MPVEVSGQHRLSVSGCVGSLSLQAEITLSAPWTVLFGPSGSGKSSLLRAICGLLPALTVAFERREGPAWCSLDRLPVHRRELAYAPQGGAVFPHLSVQDNVAFAAGGSLVAAALELFELQSLARRMPRTLSGGERQRVSLARAFAVPGARLMLLDEPFTGLDRRLRERLLPKMQAELARRRLPALSVTHDVEETLLLDAEVLRVEDGRTLDQGPAQIVLSEERASMREALERRELGRPDPSAAPPER